MNGLIRVARFPQRCLNNENLGDRPATGRAGSMNAYCRPFFPTERFLIGLWAWGNLK
ncbi:hypothetical protein PQR25_19560 [Paraburkholderia nemoris]|uniref:hypothetical protein n=1 Tax=Paraburkholderia nemoris TaxID=2793076 RepID=UPI0038BA58BF